MSDFLASTVTPESQFTQSEFDVTSVDSNFRAISAVESKWRLPRLPEEVKLDLALMPELDSDSITSFLLGLDSDMNDVEEPELPELPTPAFVPQRSATDQFKIYVAGISQSKHPSEVTEDAVERFKWDAVQRGYLSPETQIDSRWSPELNSIRSQMLFDDYNERMAGNRPGAVPTNKVLEQLGKWTSPSGLLAAATELDLFWDFGAISKEWSTWGDKWRKVSESSNPLDFAKNIVDAVTGPIDDIVFPAANLLMLGTGLGALANGGKIAFLGAQAAQRGRLMRGLYSASTSLVPSSMASLQEMSWTAKRLSAHAGVLGDIGRGLAAWRELEPVARTKQVLQPLMRAGFMSQVQDLLPGYQGGASLSQLGQVGEVGAGLREFGLYSPLATPIELALTPYNIFNRGQFVGETGLLSQAGQGFLAAGGSLPGRAVLGGVAGAAAGTLAGDDTGDLAEGVTYGALAAALLPGAARRLNRTPNFIKGAVGGAAVGAGVALVTDYDPEDAIAFGAATGASLVPISSAWSVVPNPGKWVGYASDVISKFSYRPIAEDQRVTMAFQKGIRRALSPEDLERWDRTFQEKNSFVDTLADFLGTDGEGASAAVSYVMIAAAIDYTAFVQSGGRMNDSFHLYRNKLVSQLRTFDLDGETEFLPEEIARAVAIDRTGSPNYQKVFERTLSQLDLNTARELAEHHNRIAEQTLAQLMSLENMPDLDQYVRVGPWANLNADDRLGILEAYLPQALPTFGSWPKFTRQSHAVQAWVNDGVLDGAEFLPVRTAWGSTRSVKADVYKVKDKILETDDEIVGSIVRDPKVRQKMRNGRLAPLARLQPSGRVTIARKETVTKQELEEFGYQLEDLIQSAEKLAFLTQRGVMDELRLALDTAGTNLADIPKDQLAAFIRANGFGKNQSQIRHIHSFMNRHGIGDADLAAMIDEQISTMAENAEIWAHYGLDPIIRNADRVPMQGLQALKQRRKDVLHKARYTAAEIDMQSVLRSVRETQGDEAADDVLAQFLEMQADGYKLVHGVEYMMPHDLAVNTNLFKDIGVREMNAQTLGNAFGRRHPAVARMQQERRERAMLVKALADNDLGDYAPDDERISFILKDLRSILNEIQDPIAQRIEERHLLSFMDRRRLALESTFAPLRVEDLTHRRKFVLDRLVRLGWDEKEADAIFTALRHFRNTEFKDLGLYAFEAKMRERNELVSLLKFMGGTKYSNGLTNSPLIGMAAGGYTGQRYAMGGLDEDASEDQQLGARLLGIAGGALAGGLAAKGVASFMGSGDRMQRAIQWAEKKPGFMIADHFARWRDGLRFGLSPIFDLSRYTEGLMLSQTGVPLRHPVTGQRISLPLNMSPHGVKKRLGEQAWKTARDEYNRLGRGRGVGDIDVLDDAGHWFTQVGIMGFSPQDWQIGAYAELKHIGVSAEEAFLAARNTHTYGTRGRSPAELSVNFVFFPFSFQKKALGSVAKWLNDDLGRSIIIHDGLAAYQALDEKYNLDEFFKDHIPAMDVLRRFNLLAYGLSPGRFGGINSQAFETLGRSAILFSPIGVNIQDRTDFIELQNAVRSLVPAYNDLNWMIEEVKDSAGLASPSRELYSAQVRDGYNEWNEYRQALQAQLDEQGYTWSDMQHKPHLAQTKLAYEAKRAELGATYPGWKKSREESIFNIQALEMERNDLLATAAADPQNASVQALMLAQFESKLDEVKQLLSYQGVSVDGSDGWTDAPLWAFEYLIEQAVMMYEADPRFKSIWKKFYERQLGPLEAKL